MKFSKLFIFLVIIIFIQACNTRKPADLILFNGKVLTIDDQFSIQEAVVVKSGRIIAVGSNDLTRQYDAGQSINLEGKVLMPGFNDTHIHINGNASRYIDLIPIRSIEEL